MFDMFPSVCSWRWSVNRVCPIWSSCVVSCWRRNKPKSRGCSTSGRNDARRRTSPRPKRLTWNRKRRKKTARYVVHMLKNDMWVRSRNCGCLVTWFCYQMIAKPGNKTATVSWPDSYIFWRTNFMSMSFGLAHVDIIRDFMGSCHDVYIRGVTTNQYIEKSYREY